ncbi:hypothetical protein SY88_23015 [Clostridiales bacterium PH28_bin88]|nr:hypothetical protein SY88_23015 [Clostridiales bacterium PH28_bin88]
MKLSGLVACGIGRVITLMEEDERDWLGKPFIPYGSRLHALAAAAGRPIEVVRHPIRDGGVPTPERMRIILDDIKASHARGTPVYVHCWGGKGRTGTVVGCFLMRCGMAESESVLDMIDRMRREDPKRYDPSPENDRQREMVTFWRERS